MHSSDRECWYAVNPERVVLLDDLRRYAEGLHIGQLGWTVPASTDGYKWVDVRFDNGPCLPILTFGFQRGLPEKAETISRKLIEANRNTRFDADEIVAERCRQEWIRAEFSPFIDIEGFVELGTGIEELYAFTFPSLMLLAEMRNETRFPVKVGYTGKSETGSLGRIRQLMGELAAYPEKARVLIVHRTDAGRKFESKVHRELRNRGKKLTTAMGKEWFRTNTEELIEICNSVAASLLKNG